MKDDIINIAKHLPVMARLYPDKEAIAVSSGEEDDGKIIYRAMTFSELDKESDKYAHGMAKLDIKMGTRVLLMVSPGFDFTILAFALFKTGAAPVLIDPGMGKANLLNCVQDSRPEVMIAVGKAHLAKMIYPRFFKTVKRSIIVGKSFNWAGAGPDRIWIDTEDPFDIAKTKSDDMAAIIFTTGSTGPPKGVVYTHGMFDAQLTMIRDHYGLTEKDIDLPVFPLFALFSIALGMSVVIPEMDPTRPADLDPQKIVNAITQKHVTFTFGSPAVWRKVSAYCAEKGIRLLSLKKILMAGAPVRKEIHDRLLNKILAPGAMTYTPYGCTEGLPISDITGREVMDETWDETCEGRGICVGYPLPGIVVEVIKITDEPEPEWSDDLKVRHGEIGEFVASGPVVSREYFRLPEPTRYHKIYDRNSGTVRHRMGDLGYVDDKGRMWFCGRKSHRVIVEGETLFADQCEALFNADPYVVRTALVGVGEAPGQTPVIIAELNKKGLAADKDVVIKSLLGHADGNVMTKPIKTILFHKKFPTDVRHNAKIFREQLKAWAEKKTKKAY
ncbi:AMP-dependent synthetase/ligase in alkane synthesis cluster [hydrothermal vent metagenome]|uniref:AMP-dependent synthetase/ligase in alkane synthesis cluster n=1 Tax=hydrothermal vent metagenome TaxID=652676 RepID=A0A3B1D1Q2_9ZZZZ